MLAFNEEPELKDFVLEQLSLHREADKIVRGQYWKNGKGCAVGCTLEAVRLRRGKDARIDHEAHRLYEVELGIPQVLARLEDRIFETLPNEVSQHWPERFISAIRPGADLTLIWPRFALWLLSEELPQYTARYPKSTVALADVAALYREWTETGKNPERSRWMKARASAAAAASAYAAAAYAAYAAASSAYAAASASAYAAAYAASAAYAAASSAYAAASASAARRTARVQAVCRQADKLIELLAAA